MATVSRILHTNLVQAVASTITASSADAAFPVRWLRDQLRSKPWRSTIGWTIVAGFNDKIDFNRGGVKLATIAAGYYATGAALATAIVTALEAADATPVWACSYSATTFKFTISSDLAFTLLFGTGANVSTAVHKCIGFAVTDTGSATSHVAGSTAYQSRQYIGVDLGSALAITAGVVIGHNAGTGGTFKLRSSATSVLAAVTAPSADQALAGDANIRIVFFSSQSHRYLALLIEDVQNTDGFSEVGILFAGVYGQPSVTYSISYSEDPVELSVVDQALHGAPYVDQRPRQDVFNLEWSEITEADLAILEAWEAASPKGKACFFAFDPVTTPTDTRYVYRTGQMRKQMVGPAPSGSYWTVTQQIAEALG